MQVVACEWGMNGLLALREQAAVIVIVDVLSFSTAVDVAVSRGASVYPFALGDRAATEQAAANVGAVLAMPRRTAGGQFSLSPQSLLSAKPGLKLMLPSPNGSRLTLETGDRVTFAGCLRNAAAVASAARTAANGGQIAVIAAGERWPDGSLRPAIEDMLGAGAIIHHLDLRCTAEADAMKVAYRSSANRLHDLITDSVSGRELINAGFAGDVELALEGNMSCTAPRFSGGSYGV